MTVPLIVLAAFSLFAGILNPGFHIMQNKPLDHWLEPVFRAATTGAVLFGHGNDAGWAERLEWPLAAGGVLAFASGTAIAWWIYVSQKGEPAHALSQAVPGLYGLLLDKWRVDELYDATVLAGVDSLAETSAVVDKTVIDGTVARLPALVVGAAGSILRTLQNGVVHVYAATMVVGLTAIGWFLTVPHANATVVDAGNDDYLLTAAPGVGYGYRWDADGDGKADSPSFTGDATLKLHVEPGKALTVNLEVKNAFGLVRNKVIHVARPSAAVTSL
jgi:NADH-quinone oxidoreductase subunit L